MKPSDLIATARRLAKASAARPRQSDLKRAVSTAYYAIFHALCRNCADCLIGSKGSDRSNPAWVQTYRAVEHGHAKAKCKDGIVTKFPKDIEDFAAVFIEAQEARHRADYDPNSRFTRSETLTLIAKVEEAIKSFQKVGIKDRRAFSALIILKGNRQ